MMRVSHVCSVHYDARSRTWILSTSTMANVTEDLRISFYSILIYLNANIKYQIWLVATMLDGTVLEKRMAMRT